MSQIHLTPRDTGAEKFAAPLTQLGADPGWQQFWDAIGRVYSSARDLIVKARSKEENYGRNIKNFFKSIGSWGAEEAVHASEVEAVFGMAFGREGSGWMNPNAPVSQNRRPTTSQPSAAPGLSWDMRHEHTTHRLKTLLQYPDAYFPYWKLGGAIEKYVEGMLAGLSLMKMDDLKADSIELILKAQSLLHLCQEEITKRRAKRRR